MPSHSLRADLLMLLTAMIWGSVFVAQRLGMDSIGPFLYSGLRFGLAALILLPVLHLLQGRAQSAPLPAVNRQLLLGGSALLLPGLAEAIVRQPALAGERRLPADVARMPRDGRG